MEQNGSIPGFQTTATSRIRPELPKSGGGIPLPLSTDHLPVLNLASVPGFESLPAGSAPLTIFYGGSVAVFNVPHDKAEAIMKLAGEVKGSATGLGREQATLLKNFNEDMVPGARNKSLQWFLEKRKQRLKASVPYDLDRSMATKPTEKIKPTNH